jgi:splicing factor 3B subunit 3
LDYDPKTSSFVKLHQETLGKSGARRIVPGQYFSTDPKGRSVMIAAMEKARLNYIPNRDAATNLTISSPLEAHKNAAIIHHVVGLDVGFENPVFAALAVDYTESDQDPSGEAFSNVEKVRLFVHTKTQPTMFVNIGLQNGVSLRTVLDPITGQLTDTRTR